MLAFQTNFCNYPRGTITALSQIRNIVAIKDASFNVDLTLDNIKEARAAKRRIGSLTGSDTFILEAMLMGCDGALIGFAATATDALIVSRGDPYRRPASRRTGRCPCRP
jgi:4-hydroxy-tetrahydrodipicolinate synthase